MLATVEDESSIWEALNVLSSFDCRYFLLSGILRRNHSVANAGTKATPI